MLRVHHKVMQQPRLYHGVAQRIREVVRHDAIAPGERLPSERELSARLSVSRQSLREAMIALELGGEVEVRGGSGVYLTSGDELEQRLPHTGSGPFEVLAARRVIEPELAAIAARVATDGAIDAIMAAARELQREPVDTQDSERASRLFHRRIALATGNGVLVGLLDYLWEQPALPRFALQQHYQSGQLRKAALAG
jgi:DNA-binding FadR family transcriptional regulator